MSKITSFTVGGKFQSSENYTSHTFEVSCQLDENEDIEKAVKDCKLFVAEQVSGGISYLYEKALKVLRVSKNEELIREKIKALEKLDDKRTDLMISIKNKGREYKDLSDLNSLVTDPEISNEFWKQIKEIGERNYTEPPPADGKDGHLPF